MGESVIGQGLMAILLRSMNSVFAIDESRRVDEREAEPEIKRIQSKDVRNVLKGRRLPRSRRAFRSFDSPPGRF